METQLYREKIRDIENAKRGIIAGNFNALFEGSGFDPSLAESIATAEDGNNNGGLLYLHQKESALKRQ